jgi:hypothetical protein
MQPILSGNVYWAYDHDIEQADTLSLLGTQFSGTPPLSKYHGEILLGTDALYLSGDNALVIPLQNIEQIYMGFDDTYRVTYVKNWGLTWQPIRLVFDNGEGDKVIYLIIDHNFLFTNNKRWFETLKELLVPLK